jgi:hypothetical protein
MLAERESTWSLRILQRTAKKLDIQSLVFASACRASERSTALIEIISIADRCDNSPGTMIIMATSLKLGNECPSIISASVMTSQTPGASCRSMPR